MQITIKTKHPGHYSTLEQYVEQLHGIMIMLKNEYRLKLPMEIVLRPLKPHGSDDCVNLTFARAGFTHNYWIALNMKILHRETTSMFSLSILAHEAAHIAEALKTGRWGHGKLFQEIEKKAIKHVQRGGNQLP